MTEYGVTPNLTRHIVAYDIRGHIGPMGERVVRFLCGAVGLAWRSGDVGHGVICKRCSRQHERPSVGND